MVKLNTFHLGLKKRKDGTKLELKFYDVWHHMNDRCYKQTSKKFKNYGVRGIKVDWPAFGSFFKDMWPSFLIHLKENGFLNTTLDRINPNGNYCKDNCRWATQKEQQRNRTNTILISLNGNKKTLGEWAEKYNLPYKKLWARIYQLKMPLKKALSKIDHRL